MKIIITNIPKEYDEDYDKREWFLSQYVFDRSFHFVSKNNELYYAHNQYSLLGRKKPYNKSQSKYVRKLEDGEFVWFGGDRFEREFILYRVDLENRCFVNIYDEKLKFDFYKQVDTFYMISNPKYKVKIKG